MSEYQTIHSTSKNVEETYLDIPLSPKLKRFLQHVKIGIKYRIDNCKTDAYFILPNNISFEQLTILLKNINSFDKCFL